jgi:ATP-dependent phosphoenolpyruvate carboxykinase
MAKLPIFDLAYPKEIQGVDTHILNPADSWADKK